MPIKIRIWLGITWLFAPLIELLVKVWHSKSGADPSRYSERMGHTAAKRPIGVKLVWIHAASLGELGQCRALFARLSKLSNTRILITTFSDSGADWVAQEMPDAVHQFLPLDMPRAVSGFLDHWSPDSAIFVEGDLWPRLLLAINAREIPMTLINARPSSSRHKSPNLHQFVLSLFDAITCKSTAVRDDLIGIGLTAHSVHYFGDLRAEATALPVDNDIAKNLMSDIGARPVWIAASTHAADEAAVVTACHIIRKTQPDALLIWAPRHPRRATDIRRIATDLTVSQRSSSDPITAETAIYLADTLGELGTLFSCADIVFLGGSFGDEGGHNPFEPAQFGCKVLTGPRHRNHDEGFATLMQNGAAFTVNDGMALGAKVTSLLASPKLRNAQITPSIGAAQKTAELIIATLKA